MAAQSRRTEQRRVEREAKVELVAVG